MGSDLPQPETFPEEARDALVNNFARNGQVTKVLYDMPVFYGANSGFNRGGRFEDEGQWVKVLLRAELTLDHNHTGSASVTLLQSPQETPTTSPTLIKPP